MVRWVCPCREQSGIDQGLRVSHSLCFWNLVLGETFWPKPCRRICPADSGVTVSPLRNGVLQEMMKSIFPSGTEFRPQLAFQGLKSLKQALPRGVSRADHCQWGTCFASRSWTVCNVLRCLMTFLVLEGSFRTLVTCPLAPSTLLWATHSPRPLP